MMRKTIILGLLVFSLLAVSTLSVQADDSLSVDDDIHDVVNDFEEIVTRDNIDIANVACEVSGDTLECTLTLIQGGVITDSESIIYGLYVSTTENEYTVLYSYGECVVYDIYGGEPENIEYSGVGTRTITISFEMSDSDDEPLEIYGTTMDLSDTDTTYIDSTEIGEPNLTVSASASSQGKVGESIDFSGSASGGTSPYEYSWDFGDGEAADERNPSHTFTEEGEYEVLLLVTDSNDDYGFDTVVVTISASGSSGDGDSTGSGSNLTLFIALIAIVVVIGLAVLFYVMRR